MTENQRKWAEARDGLGRVLADLGYPEELGGQLPTTEVAGLYLPSGQRLTPSTFGF